MLARKSGGKLGRLGGRSLQAVSCDVPRPHGEESRSILLPAGQSPTLTMQRDVRSHRDTTGLRARPGAQRTASLASMSSHPLAPQSGIYRSIYWMARREELVMAPADDNTTLLLDTTGSGGGRPIVAGPLFCTPSQRRILFYYGANGRIHYPLTLISGDVTVSGR